MKAVWYETIWFKRSVILGFTLLVLIKAGHSIFFKENDFNWHLGLGETALNGTPYVTGAGAVTGNWYPPGRVVIDEVLALLLPITLARALVFACAIGGLLLTFRIWRVLANAVAPATADLHLAAGALAFLLLAPWVVRDLDDCGLQILLLCFLSLAGWSLWRGTPIAAGAWLALAITFKGTPLIFLPLLIWKRRWVETAATLGFLIVFNLVVPAMVWGPGPAREALGLYFAKMQEVANRSDLSENTMEPPDHRNQSLPFAMARYLQTYPPGHPLFIHKDYGNSDCQPRVLQDGTQGGCEPHRFFVQFLSVPAPIAKRIIFSVLLLLAGVLAWRMRRRWSLSPAVDIAKPHGTGAFAPEWASTCALAALLSPVAWVYHFVPVLPCAYLAVRGALMFPTRWRWFALGVVFLCVWVSRDPLSRQLSRVVFSYHTGTLAVLILLVLTLSLRVPPGYSESRHGAVSAGTPA